MGKTISWDVSYYELLNGKQPFYERLNEIRDTRAQTKIVKSVNRMKFGNFNDSNPVGGGVSEKCLNYGPGYRIYYAKTPNREPDSDNMSEGSVLILYVGDKSTQDADIKYAKNCLLRYKKIKNSEV